MSWSGYIPGSLLARRPCSCGHHFDDHEDPHWCTECDKYCDYDGDVPLLDYHPLDEGE